MTTLSVRLAELRQMAGLSASELGGLAGLSRATVSMIESGKRPDPAASTISSLARVLGDRRSYLLSGTGAAPSKDEVRAAVESARKQPQPELPAAKDSDAA